MKKLSLKGLADYMTATDSHKRKILRDYKYPDAAVPKILYYRDSCDRISAYHSAEHDIDWLSNEANNLVVLALANGGRKGTRLKHNARALKEYAKHFRKKKFKVLGETTLGLRFDDVTVTVHPDLYVEENGNEKVIKLAFGQKEPDARLIKIINQCTFKAIMQEGLDIPYSSVLYFDVPRGRVHKGAPMGSRMTKDVEAACKNISAIWDSI